MITYCFSLKSCSDELMHFHMGIIRSSKMTLYSVFIIFQVLISNWSIFCHIFQPTIKVQKMWERQRSETGRKGTRLRYKCVRPKCTGLLTDAGCVAHLYAHLSTHKSCRAHVKNGWEKKSKRIDSQQSGLWFTHLHWETVREVAAVIMWASCFRITKNQNVSVL